MTIYIIFLIFFITTYLCNYITRTDSPRARANNYMHVG